MDNKINEIRQEIDKMDSIIVDALVKRIDCVLEVVKYKKNEEEVRGCDRVKIVLDKVKNLAKSSGGHEDIVADIYQQIINILTNMQLKILSKRAES
jgi:chorismate mutase